MRVLLVDDHTLVSEAIGATLQKFQPTAEPLYAVSLAAALDHLRGDPKIDLILLDLTLRDVDGLTGLFKLRDQHPSIPIVVVSANEDRDTVVAALDAGAMGFIPKSSSTDLLNASLSVIFAGGIYIPPLVLNKAAPGAVSRSDHSSITMRCYSIEELGLTPRDIEVLRYLVRGLSNKEIAKKIGISDHTVRKHVTIALRTLHARNRTDAMMECARLGLQLHVAREKK